VKATLIDKMGDDLTVVNAARVSFDKLSTWDWSGFDDETHGGVFLREKDTKLIHYLAKHGHWTPFAHPQLTLHVKAPIFVARQLDKHQVGLVKNEVSRRYVDESPEFYIPTKWRKRAADKKQGSSPEEFVGTVSWEFTPEECMYELYEFVSTLYDDMISAGICPEQARMVLPQSMYTEWYWTGSLYAFLRVCKERLSDDAQAETRQIAWDIADILMANYPVSWGAFYAHNMPVTLPAREIV
jgi:thymidylate synthase (FAD)